MCEEEATNRAVYRNGHGLRLVPIVIVFQRFLYIYSIVPWKYTPRGCLEPCIQPADYDEWMQKGVSIRNGYWVVTLGGTIAGLHALSYCWDHQTHPQPGIFPFTNSAV